MTEEELIRSSWHTAFCENKVTGSKIDWAFSAQDLLVLCCLHEANLHRKEIEDLLEDCNFHSENGMLKNGKYDEFRKTIVETMLLDIF